MCPCDPQPGACVHTEHPSMVHLGRIISWAVSHHPFSLSVCTILWPFPGKCVCFRFVCPIFFHLLFDIFFSFLVSYSDLLIPWAVVGHPNTQVRSCKAFALFFSFLSFFFLSILSFSDVDLTAHTQHVMFTLPRTWRGQTEPRRQRAADITITSCLEWLYSVWFTSYNDALVRRGL